MKISRRALTWRTTLRLLWLWPLIGLLSTTQAAEPSITPEQLAPIRNAINNLIHSELESQKLAGLSLALVEDQKIVWAEGFGYADKVHRVPARPETLNSVGGLSTLLTSFAILRYADEGRIDLDQPIKKYLPDFSIRTRFGDAGPIRVRHLLSHHSGLPAMHFRDMWTPKPEPLAAFVNRLKDEYVAFPPDTVFSPSFPAYDVLGRVIETECRKPFASCMHEQVLEPLGMPNSTFDISQAKPALLAKHYWKEKVIQSQTVRDTPAAGLVSSVSELARFIQTIFAEGKSAGKQILKPQMVQEMLRVQNSDVVMDLDTQVGLAWRLSGVRLPNTSTVAWLSNESPFSRGRIVLAPEHKLGVVVLTNSSNSTELVEKVSERILQMVLQDRKPVATVHAQPAPAAALKREDIVGHYATSLGLITVSASNNRYHAHMLGKKFSLMRQTNGLFAPEYRLLGLIPIPISVLKEARMTTLQVGKQHLAVAYYRQQMHRLGERIEPVKLSPAWRQRLGDYQLVEGDLLTQLLKFDEVSLVEDDGVFFVHHRVRGWLGLVADIPLRPVSDTEAVIAGTGWLMGETLQIVQRQGKEFLTYSGYEFQRVKSR